METEKVLVPALYVCVAALYVCVRIAARRHFRRALPMVVLYVQRRFLLLLLDGGNPEIIFFNGESVSKDAQREGERMDKLVGVVSL